MNERDTELMLASIRREKERADERDQGVYKERCTTCGAGRGMDCRDKCRGFAEFPHGIFHKARIDLFSRQYRRVA